MLAGKFACFPLLVYVLERAIRLRNTDWRSELRVIECVQLADKVTFLKFEKPPNFKYLPGQYCFIAVPAINKVSHALEFHPFTISSAPHEPFLTLHIRSVGDWTSKLHQLASRQGNGGRPPATDSPTEVQTVLLDGPFGSASEEVYDYDVVIMCARIRPLNLHAPPLHLVPEARPA